MGSSRLALINVSLTFATPPRTVSGRTGAPGSGRKAGQIGLSGPGHLLGAQNLSHPHGGVAFVVAFDDHPTSLTPCPPYSSMGTPRPPPSGAR